MLLDAVGIFFLFALMWRPFRGAQALTFSNNLCLRRRPRRSAANGSGPRRTTATTRSRIVMMPEGPEVRTLVDQLQPAVGRRLTDWHFASGRYTRSPSAHQPAGWEAFRRTMTRWKPQESSPAEKVDTITEWNCKGKFMYILLDRGSAAVRDPDFQRSIWITLGMTGRFLSDAAYRQQLQDGAVAAAAPPAPPPVRWTLHLLDVAKNETTRIHYQDKRNFGTLRFSLSRQELVEKLSSLGPDLLQSLTEQDFVNIATEPRSQKRNVCKFLMDQTKISGVGNYILAEGLYRANIDPFACLEELTEHQQRQLFRELRAVAVESYRNQGMTRRHYGGEFRNVDGGAGDYGFELQCYGRQVCARGRPVHRETNGPHGRTIWYTEHQLFMPRSERIESAAEPTTSSRTLRSNSGTKRGIAEAVTDSASPCSSDTAPTFGRDVSEVLGASSPSAVATPIRTESTVAPVSSQVEPDGAVQSLLDGLTEPGWKELLSEHVQTESFRNLAVFLEEERAKGRTIFPPRKDLFSALNLCPLDEVKVVIIGQDPYHGPGQAHGLAFSVQKGVRAPPSLQNIIREAIEDVGIEEPHHGNLEHWAKQGVLLLNAVLTVRQGEANSHAKKGWEEFTDAVIEKLTADEKHAGLVFLLWGNAAQKKAEAVVDGSKHTIICTSHPSPLGATKTGSPFLGSKCFSRTNTELINLGKEPIDWNLD